MPINTTFLTTLVLVCLTFSGEGGFLPCWVVFGSAAATACDNYNNKAAVQPGQSIAFADTLKLA